MKKLTQFLTPEGLVGDVHVEQKVKKPALGEEYHA
jgi:hypothetical protein